MYVTGSTNSMDFPTLSPIQPALAGGLDAFVTKLSAGRRLPRYSTYLGGAGDDAAQAIAVDVDGIAYLTGSTTSAAFPTATPIQNAAGLLDAFVTQIADGGIIQFTAASYQAGETPGASPSASSAPATPAGRRPWSSSPAMATATAGADYTVASPGTHLRAGAGRQDPGDADPRRHAARGRRDRDARAAKPGRRRAAGAAAQATLTILDDEPLLQRPDLRGVRDRGAGRHHGRPGPARLWAR